MSTRTVVEQTRDFLIERAIGKWDLIAHGLIGDRASQNCVLCNVYLHNTCVHKGRTLECFECPVSNKTGYSQCKGTPYWDYRKLLEENSTMYLRTLPSIRRKLSNMYCISVGDVWKRQFFAICDTVEKEIEFLVSLLPEDHRYRQL